MVLAWAATGIELFAVIAVLIAAGSATVAFANTNYRQPSGTPMGACDNPRGAEARAA